MGSFRTAPKSGLSTVWIVVLSVLGVVVVIIGLGVVFAVASIRRFNRQVKIAEGQNIVREIGRDASRCAGDAEETWRGLPASTLPVPATLAEVSGRKYVSSSADWSAEPWKCMQFAMSAPQHLQYRWTRRSDLEGVAEAMGDLDGDGQADFHVAQEVRCAPENGRTACVWTSPLVEAR